MSDEEKGTATDEALDKAAEEVKTQDTETVPDEKVETKTEVDILKEINNLKAEIGRGGKALHEVTTLKNELTGLKELLSTQQAERQTQADAERYVATVDDVKKVFQELKIQEQKEVTAYNENYLNEIARLAIEDGLPDDQFGKLEEILSTSIKGSKTGFKQPLIDAEINYNKAMRLLNTGKKVNLKGDTPKGTIVGVTSQNQTKDVPVPKLDADAQAYAEAMGMTPEMIKAALTGDAKVVVKNKL